MEYSHLGEFPPIEPITRTQALEVANDMNLRGSHELSLLVIDGFDGNNDWAVEAIKRYMVRTTD